jgi:hypothetical protein
VPTEISPVVLVGKRLHGDDWIGGLTSRQEWLVERYAPRTTPSSLLPGGITYIPGTSLLRAPASGPLRDEIDAAIDRRDWMLEQYENARRWLYKWLEREGLRSDEIDPHALERALHKELESAATADAPAPAKRTKIALAKRACIDEWPPNGKPPPGVLPTEVRKRIGDRLKAASYKHEDFSDTTLNRAAGLRKDRPRKQ